MRTKLIATSLVFMTVGLVVLIKLGFDTLEQDKARRPSPKDLKGLNNAFTDNLIGRRHVNCN